MWLSERNYCLVLWALCLWTVEGAISTSDCTSAKDCSECLRLPRCAWCANKDLLDTSTSYCNTREFWNSQDGQELCENRLLDEHSSVVIVEDLPLSSVPGNIVQLKPQKIKLRTRPHDTTNLTVSVGHAANYPLDVYFLMDLSLSMREDKDKLSQLGTKLGEALQQLTSNYLIGFGSFVDKERAPFVNERLYEQSSEALPYSYWNHMSLDTDVEKFIESVQQANISVSMDTPEGAFDALMQAMVCNKEIGWREESRKLIILATDADYHLAGDGKLAGAVEPNDGQCHLDANGRYTKSVLYDYPSIAQLAYRAIANGVNIIFAVDQVVVPVYEALVPRIKGASVEILEENSENIIEIVVEQYNNVISTVELVDTARDPMKVSYYSSCLSASESIRTSKCSGLQRGDTVQFTISIQVVDSKISGNHTETFSIQLVGLKESLVVEVEIISECECDSTEDLELECQNGGKLHCGLCRCPEGFSGRKCQCNADTAFAENRDRCRKNNGTEICSGRGQCECGVCVCDKTGDPNQVISGDFCECTNFSCPQTGGEICSGRGTCNCDGTCACEPGWRGDACECSMDTEACTNPADGQICSGKGTCECGKCKCTETAEGQHIGTYCEECPTCAARCGDYKDCVRCKAYGTGPHANDSCAECLAMTLVLEDYVEVKSTKERMCSFYDDDKCQFTFVYDVDVPNSIRAEEEKKCAAEANPVVISLGLIASIVLAGLVALLFWKLATYLHDRREYALFEKERENAQWNRENNPLYKEVTVTYKNPIYPQ